MRYLIAMVALATLVQPALAQQATPPGPATYTLVLPAQGVATTMMALRKAPLSFDDTSPWLQELSKQIEAQQKAAAAPAAGDKVSGNEEKR